MNRRQFLRTAAAASAVAGAGAVAGTATTGTAAAEPDPATWFDDVANYDGVEDHTGTDAVTVEVGTDGGFSFGPAAIRVDPGTTVTWEWTGEGGFHNVSAKDGSFESELTGDAGFTFEHTFDADGTTFYACVPHEAMGMKGAVVVGNAVVASTVETEPDYDGWLDDAPNYESTLDLTGKDEVGVSVGVDANGDPAFDPPAIKVDPGTVVRWEWTGDGGTHSVADPDHGFASPHHSDAGATYALEFDGEGISKYSCPGHLEKGMKGVVVVGDVVEGQQAAVRNAESLTWVLLVAAALSPIGLSFLLPKREPNTGEPYRRPPGN